jgi:hypothetical protein
MKELERDINMDAEKNRVGHINVINSLVLVLGFLIAILASISAIYGLYKLLPFALSPSKQMDVPFTGLTIILVVLGIGQMNENIIIFTRSIAARIEAYSASKSKAE